MKVDDILVNKLVCFENLFGALEVVEWDIPTVLVFVQRFYADLHTDYKYLKTNFKNFDPYQLQFGSVHIGKVIRKFVDDFYKANKDLDRTINILDQPLFLSRTIQGLITGVIPFDFKAVIELFRDELFGDGDYLEGVPIAKREISRSNFITIVILSSFGGILFGLGVILLLRRYYFTGNLADKYADELEEKDIEEV